MKILEYKGKDYQAVTHICNYPSVVHYGYPTDQCDMIDSVKVRAMKNCHYYLFAEVTP